MLTEDRLNRIIAMVNQSGSVTTTQLMRELDSSESTIRRDLAVLDRKKDLIKVRGGAIAIHGTYGTKDDEVVLRKSRSIEEKRRIAAYAAGLITDEDFVFLDAGTTTELLIPFIRAHKAIFVTNALSHAMKLSEQGLSVYILGGAFKNTTEAIVGEEAIASLTKYNFTKGFFGTNGVHREKGFTTPEIRESQLKGYAMKKCRQCYVLADHTKLDRIFAITFGDYESATVVTDQADGVYTNDHNVTEVKAS